MPAHFDRGAVARTLHGIDGQHPVCQLPHRRRRTGTPVTRGVRASPDASSTVSRACSPARGGPAGADQGGVPANFHRRRGAAVSRNRVRLVAQDLATGAHGLDSACAARSVASAARIAPAVSPRMRCRQNSSSWICTSPGCCRGARLDRRLVAVRVKGHLRLVVGCPYAVWAWTRAPLARAGSPSWMRFGPHRPASVLSR